MQPDAVLSGLTPTLVAFGIGIALAGAPGPVQAVLVSEAMRGGVGRGLRALAGASLTFGSLLAAVALGWGLTAPDPGVVRILKVAGGVLLLWLAFDAIRSDAAAASGGEYHRGLPPAARGSLAVALNPGAWLFTAAVASPLIAASGNAGGTPAALLSAAALMGGAALGDGAIVLLGGLGLRRAGRRAGHWIHAGLATLLGLLGLTLLAGGLVAGGPLA